MIYLKLFLIFFQIGLFGFGGGYGMISMIQTEVVWKTGWLSSSEFTDIVAISQMTPGPIGINCATYTGFTAVANQGLSTPLAIIGSIVATTALILPSLILMIIISKMLLKYMKSQALSYVFLALRPTVIGLLAAAALLLMTPDNFGSPNESTWQFGVSIVLFLATLAATLRFKINPIKMIVISAIVGLLLLYDI